jgi:hypothetical protein
MDYTEAVRTIKAPSYNLYMSQRSANRCIRAILTKTTIGEYKDLENPLKNIQQLVSKPLLPAIDACLRKNTVERIVHEAKYSGNYEVCDKLLEELQQSICDGLNVSKRDRAHVAAIQLSILAVHNIFRQLYDYQRTTELKGGTLLTLYPTEVDFTRFLDEIIATWEHYYRRGQLWFTMTPRIINGETALLGELTLTHKEKNTGEEKTVEFGGPVTFRAAGTVPDWVTPDNPLRVRVARDPHEATEHATGLMCPITWVQNPRFINLYADGIVVTIPHGASH